ncbi:MAG: sortase, partial [Candidatus Limnocylindrales bacterium]
PHRSALAMLLVLVLVAVGSPIAAARSTTSGLASAALAARGTIAASASTQVDDGPDDVRGQTLRSGVINGRRVVVPDANEAAPRDWISRPTPAVPQPNPKAQSATAQSEGQGDSSTAAGSGTSYRGRNHVWIPALGIDRSISFFSCTSPAYPGDRVYRWGCAGGNNVYLFGHAHSVFKPLHDAYVRGRLKKGMKLVYADRDGRISTYRVAWWKVTTPDKGEFAYAAQSQPSVTLQTCVGAKSQYRLIVRLTKVD